MLCEIEDEEIGRKSLTFEEFPPFNSSVRNMWKNDKILSYIETDFCRFSELISSIETHYACFFMPSKLGLFEF